MRTAQHGNLVTLLRISAMKVNLLGMYFTVFVHHSITSTVLGGGKWLSDGYQGSSQKNQITDSWCINGRP